MNLLLETGLSNAVVAGVLALAAGAVGHFCRRPAITHGLWLLVLLKLITPPLVSIPLPWPVAAGTDIAAVPEPGPAPVEELHLAIVPAEETAGPADDLPFVAEVPPVEEGPAAAPIELAASAPADFPWRATLLTLWLIGAVGWLTLSLARAARFHRTLRHIQPASASVQAQAERLAARLGLRNCPGVWLVPGRLSPMLWAVGGSARLLLPADLLNRLSVEQRATLLAHELAHLKRCDHWVRGLELLVTALYWWHPVVWWARHELREAEEQCCDAWVVWALPGAGRTYATALVDTLDFLSRDRAAVPALASGIGPIHDLKRRLTMIMRGTTPRSLTWSGCLGLAVLAALLLPVLPTWAQTEQTQKEIEERLKAVKAQKEAVELELQLRKEDKEQSAQVERARAQIQQLKEQVEKAAAELERAKDQLRRAADQLAHLEGRGAKNVPGKGGEKIIIMIKEADGKVRTIEVPPDAEEWKRVGRDVLKRFEFEVKPGTAGVRVPVPPVPPVPPAAGVRVGPPNPDARLRDIEKRLEMLLKEMESLRKEIKAPTFERRKGSPPEEGGVLFFKDIPAAETAQFKDVPVPGLGDHIFYFRKTPGTPVPTPSPAPRQ